MSVGGIGSIQYGYIVLKGSTQSVEMALRSEGITMRSRHPEETWQLSLVIVVNSHSLETKSKVRSRQACQNVETDTRRVIRIFDNENRYRS